MYLLQVVCHGDGLSVERHRDSQRARAGALTEECRLQGLVSTPQEFHERGIIMQVNITILNTSELLDAHIISDLLTTQLKSFDSAFPSREFLLLACYSHQYSQHYNYTSLVSKVDVSL